MGAGFIQKPIRISEHARKRMTKYGVGEEVVIKALREPDKVLVGHRGRRTAHRFKNNHVLRVVYEENDIYHCDNGLSSEAGEICRRGLKGLSTAPT